MSVAWSRIQPTGSGPVNTAGLDHYDRVVDGLVARGIRPMVTLFHGDLPQALEDDGGWLNRATTERFAEYAGIVGERLADRVEHWVPINEPNLVSLVGYGIGMQAPGRALYFDSLIAAHHLLLGHGRAAVALRAAGRRERRLRQQPRPDVARRARTRPTSGRPSSSTPCGTASTSRRCCSAATRSTSSRCSRTSSSPVTWPRSASPSTSTASTTTARCGSAPPTRSRRCRSSSSRWSATRSPTPAGPVVPDALREWLITFAGPVPRGAAADHHHRVGLRRRDGPGRDGPGRRPGPHRLPRRPPACRRGGHPARRRRARLLHVVAARQLRVVARAAAALRAGPRRPRDAGAHARSGRSSGTPGWSRRRPARWGDPRTGRAHGEARRPRGRIGQTECRTAIVARTAASSQGSPSHS